MQPTQCINQLSSWYGTTFRKKSRKLFRGRDLILMKLKPHVSLAGSSTNSPFRVFLSTRGPKIAQAWQKSIGVKKTHYLSVCTKSEASIWFLKAMNADKWLWPIFGCKVGQSVQIGMKLELDVWHHPLDVYAKFQTDISQHVQKNPENFSLAGSSSNTPFQVFLSVRGPKIAQPWRKWVGIKTLTI